MAELKTRILVVDDDQRLRDLLVKYLSGEGYDVKAVPDARGMDKQLGRERYDLLVLDLMLPGEDGLAICRRLRVQPRHALARQGWQGGVAHDGGIFRAQGAGAAPAPAALARQADGARARPRVRGVRPLDRRADLAAAQDRRGRSVASEAHPDRLGLRLRLRPGRFAAQVTLFARAFLLIALLIVTAVLASFQIYRVYEREPRSRELAQQTVSTVNLTRAALVNADPVLRRQLLIELNATEGLRVFPVT